MTKTSKKSIRVQLSLIAVVFLGPLLVAAFMYYSGALQPAGRTNHGVLLRPIVNAAKALPDSPALKLASDHWMLIYVNEGPCGIECRELLYKMRQSRRMLGKESRRLTRIFLHDDSPTDTVFLANEHAGLVDLQDRRLAALLKNKKPAELPDDGYYLIDPIGNLVMYFEPATDPGDMVEDIQRLLKLSHIG